MTTAWATREWCPAVGCVRGVDCWEHGDQELRSVDEAVETFARVELRRQALAQKERLTKKRVKK